MASIPFGEIGSAQTQERYLWASEEDPELHSENKHIPGWDGCRHSRDMRRSLKQQPIPGQPWGSTNVHRNHSIKGKVKARADLKTAWTLGSLLSHRDPMSENTSPTGSGWWAKTQSDHHWLTQTQIWLPRNSASKIKKEKLSRGIGERCQDNSRVSSVQFSHSVVSDSLWPCGLQNPRLPCPSLIPEVHPNPCP